jgi:hypothetical protein
MSRQLQRRETIVSSLLKLLMPRAILALVIIFSSAARAQEPGSPGATQRACTRSDGIVLRECARSCFPVCRDRGLTRENSVIGGVCNDLMVRGSRTDSAACPTLLAENAVRPDPSRPPAQPAIAANHAETQQRCNASFPGVGESIIPEDGAPPPQCFRSFLNLECRFQGLATRSTRFNSMVEQFQTRDYGTRKGPAMCELKRSIVENDYKAANQVQTPINEVKSDFEKEFGCLSEVQKWLDTRSCADSIGETKSICDERNRSVREVITGRLSGSLRSATQLNMALTAATRAVNDIRAFWGAYRIVCF